MNETKGEYCFSSLLLLREADYFNCIHPDDLPAVRRKYAGGWQMLCFRYCGRQAGYDVLDDGDITIRVRNAVIRPIPTPMFKPGDRVFAAKKNKAGIVRHIIWHLKRRKVFYVVEFDGRMSGDWYFDSDLTHWIPSIRGANEDN